MKIQIIMILALGLATLFVNFTAEAAKPAHRRPSQSSASSRSVIKPRLSIGQLQSVIETTKQRMRQERKISDRQVHLKKLMRVLQGEFQKGASTFDLTFIFVNKTQLDIEYLLGNSCKKSREIMLGQTLGASESLQARQQRDFEVKASLSLHAAYCLSQK